MDNIAHALAGAAIAKSGFQRSIPEKKATIIGVVAANIPDLDFVELILGARDNFVFHHRGFTHSFLCGLLVSLFLAWLCRKLWRNLPFWPTFFLIAAAYASHILLDLANSWGTSAAAPFNHTRYAEDILFIIDPMIWLTLGSPWLFKKWIPEVRSFRASLIVLGCYMVMCLLAHQVASTSFRHLLSRKGVQAQSIKVYPAPLAPIFWNAVAQDKTHSYQAYLTMPYGAADFARVRAHNLNKKMVQDFQAGAGAPYFEWARSPTATINAEENGVHRLLLQDLRFERNPDPNHLETRFDYTVRMQQTSQGTWEIVDHPGFEEHL